MTKGALREIEYWKDIANSERDEMLRFRSWLAQYHSDILTAYDVYQLKKIIFPGEDA